MDVQPNQETLTRPNRQPYREHRYVYGGDPRIATGGFLPRANKKVTGRRKSTFSLLLALVIAGVAIVYYVNNIIVVNRLAYDINRLEVRHDSLTHANGVLRAEVSKKSSRGRISAFAAKELQLQHPAEPATYFRIDHELAKDLRNRRKQQ
ncbi:MAG: cell division protein FtsL [Bacteroidota bacterium]